jgi:acyl-CoA thioesterase
VAIADQAFAYGVNSVAYPSVATQFNVNLINAAGPDDELTAECRVLRNGKRAGISEITVTNQEGKMIAKATGVTLRV